jgi:hypothetical protein
LSAIGIAFIEWGCHLPDQISYFPGWIDSSVLHSSGIPLAASVNRQAHVDTCLVSCQSHVVGIERLASKSSDRRRPGGHSRWVSRYGHRVMAIVFKGAQIA